MLQFPRAFAYFAAVGRRNCVFLPLTWVITPVHLHSSSSNTKILPWRLLQQSKQFSTLLWGATGQHRHQNIGLLLSLCLSNLLLHCSLGNLHRSLLLSLCLSNLLLHYSLGLSLGLHHVLLHRGL